MSFFETIIDKLDYAVILTLLIGMCIGMVYDPYAKSDRKIFEEKKKRQSI